MEAGIEDMGKEKVVNVAKQGISLLPLAAKANMPRMEQLEEKLEAEADHKEQLQKVMWQPRLHVEMPTKELDETEQVEDEEDF